MMLTVVFSAWLTGVEAVLWPGGNTTEQPGEAGIEVQTARFGSTAVQPATEGAAMHCDSVGSTAEHPERAGTEVQMARLGRIALHPAVAGALVQAAMLGSTAGTAVHRRIGDACAQRRQHRRRRRQHDRAAGEGRIFLAGRERRQHRGAAGQRHVGHAIAQRRAQHDALRRDAAADRLHGGLVVEGGCGAQHDVAGLRTDGTLQREVACDVDADGAASQRRDAGLGAGKADDEGRVVAAVVEAAGAVGETRQPLHLVARVGEVDRTVSARADSVTTAMGAVWSMSPAAVRSSSRLPAPPVMAPLMRMPAAACSDRLVSLFHVTGSTTSMMPAPVPAALSVVTVTMLVASTACRVATVSSESPTAPEATKVLADVSVPTMPAPVALAWSLAM